MGSWFDQPGGGGIGGGAPNAGLRPADVYDPYAVKFRGGGNPGYFGVSDGNTQKRKFAQVGKANLNLLDPLAAERAKGDYIALDEPTDGGPLGGINQYYDASTPGGFFSGLLGAGGQFVGDMAGKVLGEDAGDAIAKGGSDIGTFVGKTLEAPMGIVGGLGLDSVPFIAPVIDEANAQLEKNMPYLLTEGTGLKIPKNIGGIFESLMGIVSAAGNAVQRTYAGMESWRGELPPELQARIDSGEITRDRALDELVVGGQGFTNDRLHNLALSLITDPVNWLTLGVGAVGGAVKGTAAISRMFAAGARSASTETFIRLAGGTGEMADLAKLAAGGRDLSAMNLSKSQLSGMRAVLKEDVAARIANGEDIPANLRLSYSERIGMSALGPISEEATKNLVYRGANAIVAATDPSRWFSGSKSGQRSLEQLHMAASTGVMAALKTPVVARLTKVADELAADGGDRIMETIGTWGANAEQEFVAGDMANQAMQSGAIPRYGSQNVSQMAREVLANGGQDANIGKHIEIHVEKTKDIRVAALPPLQRAQETVNKLAAILDVDPVDVARVLKVTANSAGDVDADVAMAVHGMYYYRKGRDLHTGVREAMDQAASAGTLPAHIEPHDVTMVTPRTMTDLRLPDLEAAVKAGDAGLVRSITENFDDFNWMNSSTVDDSEIVAVVKDWIASNKSRLPREVELRDANGAWLPGLPTELTDWAGDMDSFGYGLANGLPSDAPLEDYWRISRGANGEIRNASPWLQFWAADVPSVRRLSRWDTMSSSMFRSIRGERIWWHQRRRFITDMASDKAGNVAIPPALGDRLFRALMAEASEGRLLPRGMAPEQMFSVVTDVLKSARDSSNQWGNLVGELTERQVVLSFLRAMEGDVSLVGATQKVTGRIKSGAPGAGANFWGRLSENLYPLMRFTLNPIFMAMEFTEPHILNFMRGIPLPLRRESEGFVQGLASYNAVRQFINASEDGLAESMEMNALKVLGAATARKQFGASTFWGRVRGARPAIAERKQAAAGIQARQLIGENLYLAFKAIKGDKFDEFWGGLEYEYGTVSRAEIGERWIASNLSLQDSDGRRVGLYADLMNPTNVGQRIRLTTEGNRPGDYTYGDVEDMLDSVEVNKSAGGALFKDQGLAPGEALRTWLRDPNTTEADWLDKVEKAGLSPRFRRVSDSAASDVYRLANGVEIEPFWKGYRDAVLREVKGATPHLTRKLRDEQVSAARAFVQAAATGKGLTEAEFIALHFAEVPRYLPTYVPDPHNVLQTLTDIRADFGHTVYRRAKGAAEYSDVTPLKWAAQAKKLDDPYYAPQVAALRSGGEDRGFLYLPLTDQALTRMVVKERGGYEPSLVATKYGSAHTDPIRAMTQRNASAGVMVRVKREKVGAARVTPQTNLKRQKSHDFTLDNDVYTADGVEVFTESGWVPFEEYVKEPGGIPTANLRSEAREEYLRHLFDADLGTPGASQSYGIDFRALHSQDERLATNDYEASGHGPINRYLRGIYKAGDYDYSGSRYTDERLQDLVDHLDALVQRGSFRQRKTLYRGTSLRAEYVHTLDKQVGENIHDAGFVSTTDLLDTAEEFIDFGEASYQPGHKKFLLEYDLPPGFNMNLIEGGEGEYLLGGLEFKVVAREKGWVGGDEVIKLRVAPVNEATLPRMNRDMLGAPMLHRRNEEMARHLAATNPDQLRSRAALAPENVREGLMEVAEEYIAKAEAARPQNTTVIGGRRFGPLTPRETLDDIIDAVDEEDIPAYHGAIAKTRGRVEELMETEGQNMATGDAVAGREYNSNAGRALVSLGAVMAEKGGGGAINMLLATMERLFRHGPSAAEGAARDVELANFQATELLRGLKNPMSMPDVSARTDDSIDAMLGNDSRRAVGRTDLSQPIIADDAAYEAAGYLTQETLDDLAAQGHAVDVAAAPERLVAPVQEAVAKNDYVYPVRSLGGSTGANLVETAEIVGEGARPRRQYVEKRGASPEHIREEATADSVYEAMGVPVPRQVLREAANLPATKRANYIEGGQTLDEFMETASREELQAVYDQLGQNFALDALLANWDVVGPDFANVIVKDGIAYRIDNGGALRYRAMGEPKGSMFGEHVSELDRMRHNGNAGAMAAFGNVSDVAVRQQVLDLDARRATILKALPEELHGIINARLDDMLEQTKDIAVPPTTGLVPDAITDASHANLVAHYNEVARLANEQGLGGFREWKPADIALLARRSREERGRVPVQRVNEALSRQTQLVPGEVYFPAGSKMEWMNPLLDLLNRTENEASRHIVLTRVQTTLLQKLRDEFGIIVTNMDDTGIGIWGDEAPQAMVPLQFVATDGRGDELADVLSYAMHQAEVWHFTPAEVTSNWAAHEARVTIHVSDHGKEMAKGLPFARGATAMQQPGGGWVLTIIDRDGLVPRLADGQADEDYVRRLVNETADGLPSEVATTTYVDYGSTYVAGPAKLPDGTYDWGGHLNGTLDRLAQRGTPSDGAVLDGVRTTYERALIDHVGEAAPDNLGRARRREPVTEHLEDRRGGSVFGTTTPVGAAQSVVRGYAAADPLTGIHELTHVFSIAGLDTSVRDAVGREWNKRVTHVEARIAILEQRIATSPTKSVVTKARNEVNTLRASIQTSADGNWTKEQEEFFAHMVIDWIDRGSAMGPDMRNAMEHFRNWLQLQQKQRATNGLPPIQASPQMDSVLQRMFSKPGVETVPYSVEDEVMRQAARQVIKSSWDEAHATQFYKKDRSMFERSINHPYIGLYPASYMWGKVLPEMVRFLALRPFGMQTPFLMWNVLREVSDSIRAQSLADPSFQQYLEENADAFMFLSMFFPALPQEIPANASLPIRRIAEQGLEGQAAYAAGGTPDDIDITRGSIDAIQYAVGPLGTLRTLSQAPSDIAGLVGSTLGIGDAESGGDVLPLR